MYIIVDSGSTKSDWVVLSNETKQYYSTMGFNPYFHKSDTIIKAILQVEGLSKLKDEVNFIYYYGAGCSSPELNAVIEHALRAIFTKAVIVVDHDLTACALATYENKPAISCIIGTGSNSCYFDGKTITEEVPALGYILGDEGSGSYFGKQLLASFLYKKLPKNIEDDLINEYELTKDKIIENVYMKPDANVYIASFVKFISRHDQEPFFKEMMYEGFKKFMEIHVCCYGNYREVKTNFIGSIAFIFRNELERAASELGISIGKIIQKPIEGLIDYHKKHLITH
jgi:glucosamine kinase